MTKAEQKQWDAEIIERLSRKFLADAVAAFAREGADMDTSSMTRKMIAKAFKRAANLALA